MRTLFLRSVAALAIAVTGAVGVNAAVGASPNVKSTTFSLHPSVPFIGCMQKNPSTTPTATATVTRGKVNDTLTLSLKGFKPGLGFDMFTVQNSNQTATGAPTPGFTNFGMAWYQSDVEISAKGTAKVTIKTILLDQIFGFDPAVALSPTNTFHVGFWFDNPNTPVPCGYPGTATPFNGEHNAGPVAFITRPNANTNLGPLCTNPHQVGATFVCNP